MYSVQYKFRKVAGGCLTLGSLAQGCIYSRNFLSSLQSGYWIDSCKKLNRLENLCLVMDFWQASRDTSSYIHWGWKQHIKCLWITYVLSRDERKFLRVATNSKVVISAFTCIVLLQDESEAAQLSFRSSGCGSLFSSDEKYYYFNLTVICSKFIRIVVHILSHTACTDWREYAASHRQNRDEGWFLASFMYTTKLVNHR